MPPITPQSSRTSLITGTVISVIVAVAAVIFAIYFYVDANRTREEAATLAKKYHSAVAEAALTGSDITELTQRAGAEDAQALGLNSGMSALDVALKERDILADRVAGAGATFDTALSKSNAAAASASDKAKAAGVQSIPNNNLAGGVETLAGAVQTRQNEIASLTQQLDAAKKQVADAMAQMTANSQALEKHLAEVRGQAEQATGAATQDRAAKDQQIAQIQDSFGQQQKALQDQLNTAKQQIQELNTKLTQAGTDMNTLRGRLGERRVSTANAIVQQPDGHIIRVTGAGTVYIDLGQGDQIREGMTFQVFDKNEGIPPLPADPTDDKNMPLGKGSIEVMRVGPGSSECRVIRATPGQNMIEGDFIENLVYDKNTKYSFLVYGNFDLDQNGVATPQEAEVVKRLVTQWGSKVTDKVNADTDFVVLGKEPLVPNFSREELQDPINQARLTEATQQAEQYETVKRQAIELHIPILNQNRFLYFIGYYELAKR